MHRCFRIPFVLAWSVALTCLACHSNSIHNPYLSVKSATSSKGMVVTAHPLASEAGITILRKGGNAADAAIAVQLALAVVYPRAGNLGGGGFMVYRSATGDVFTLDFREKAPSAASRDMYLDTAGQVIQGLSTMGILAAGIPGTVAGLEKTYLELSHSVLSWADLFQPAIALAGKGFRITLAEAERLNTFQDVFARYNPPDMPFLKNKPWKAGDLLVQKDPAYTLRLIAEHGSDGFYKGPNADAIVSASQLHHGIMTKEDLENYSAQWRKPVLIDWRGYKLHTIGPPSSGGIVLGQILHMIDQWLDAEKGYCDPANIHLNVEAERRAYAGRATFLGDADFYPVDVTGLLQPGYAAKKWSDFDCAKATPSETMTTERFILAKEKYETTHFSIVDGEGNAAAVTTTLNDNYGCKIWVPGGGYFLNNEMDDFSIKPGTLNMYGLVGGEANAIAPGKRMLSSMTPTIVEKDGKLCMVLGTPGGSAIITTVLQVFLNATVFGMDIHEAVQAPRYHHQWLPDEIVAEQGVFSPYLEEALRQKGHKIRYITGIGLVEAIRIDADGIMYGAADRRGDDHVGCIEQEKHK